MNTASAKSSLGQVPALAKQIISMGLSVFDYGAGKIGRTEKEFAAAGIRYLPYDPFNRTNESNAKSLESISAELVDAIMCANVLNVVEDLPETIRCLALITQFSTSKTCYVSVYHKPSLPKDRFVNGYIQRNWSPCCYVSFMKVFFREVEQKNGFLVCKL